MARNATLSITSLPEAKQKELSVKLAEWNTAKKKAAEWTARERELRDQIAAEYFTGKPEGTHNMTLGYGKKLKYVRTISRNPVKEELNAVLSTERTKEKESKGAYKSNLLPLIDEVISYDPKVSTSGWKGLSDESRLLLANVVTEKDGAPTLSIEDVA
jgi:hypothetical protein